MTLIINRNHTDKELKQISEEFQKDIMTPEEEIQFQNDIKSGKIQGMELYQILPNKKEIR